MGVLIKDIAAALGLSKATVSWILSGQGEAKGFNENTIKRVKEYAESVNYRPNLVARSLSLGFSKTLGLIIPFLRDSFYAQLAYYIEQEAARNGYSLIVCSSEGNGVKEYDLIHALIAKCVDGMIIAPTKTDDKGVNHLIKQDYPFVLIDRFFPEIPTNYVIVDNYQSSYDLVNDMIRKKPGKIAILVSDAHLYVMNQRIEGYRTAMHDNGFEVDSSWELFIDRETYLDDVYEKMDMLFEHTPDIDGFFFATHYLAMAAIRYFVSKGIEYHGFVMSSIHVMDGLDVLAPDMSSALFPLEDFGKESIRILLESIAEGKGYKKQSCILQNKILSRIGL